MTQFRHIVTSEDEGKEVRQITREYFDFSARLRNRIKREKLTMRNGAPTEGWHKVNEGDEISITFPDEHSNFPPEDIPLDIVFEDDDLMIINKQPGIVVHPTKGHPSGTCANGLANYMEKTGNVFKIRFVNRLDRDTSGLLIVAKNAYCQNHITDQMRKNLIHKKYIAIVKGELAAESGTIDLPIGRPDPEDVKEASHQTAPLLLLIMKWYSTSSVIPLFLCCLKQAERTRSECTCPTSDTPFLVIPCTAEKTLFSSTARRFMLPAFRSSTPLRKKEWSSTLPYRKICRQPFIN